MTGQLHNINSYLVRFSTAARRQSLAVRVRVRVRCGGGLTTSASGHDSLVFELSARPGCVQSRGFRSRDRTGPFPKVLSWSVLVSPSDCVAALLLFFQETTFSPPQPSSIQRAKLPIWDYPSTITQCLTASSGKRGNLHLHDSTYGSITAETDSGGTSRAECNPEYHIHGAAIAPGMPISHVYCRLCMRYY